MPFNALSHGDFPLKAEGSADSMMVSANGTEQTFAIADIAEVTFGDAELTVVKLDGTSLSFSDEWKVTFSDVQTSTISSPVESLNSMPVEVFDAEGRFVMKSESLDVFIRQAVASGVYIIKCNGASLKIRR